jgi:hypothetical protein
MKWFRIPKETSPRPKKGKHYFDWKQELSIEGKQQCVYCTININTFGGIRNFHVEHYRPKATNKFPMLENEYSNLFFACSICNCFKSDEWKNEPTPTLDNESFPDPSKVNYSDFLLIDDSQLIHSNYITGRYIIQKLFLNRPQLILERRSFILHETLKQESEKLKAIVDEIKKIELNNPIIDGLIDMIQITIKLIEGKYINPYNQEQIKR